MKDQKCTNKDCDRGYEDVWHPHNGDDKWIPCKKCNPNGKTVYGETHPKDRPKTLKPHME